MALELNLTAHSNLKVENIYAKNHGTESYPNFGYWLKQEAQDLGLFVKRTDSSVNAVPGRSQVSTFERMKTLIPGYMFFTTCERLDIQTLMTPAHIRFFKDLKLITIAQIRQIKQS